MAAYTHHKTFKLEKGLTLEERVRESTLKARAHVRGKSHYLNTETQDFDRASRMARSWFYRLKGDFIPGSREQVTMHEAAKSFIRDIRKPVRRRFYAKTWSAIGPFFQAVDVDAVDTPLLKKLMRWRSGVKPITLAKDFVTVRQILRYSIEEGWLTYLPVFPRVGKLDANPRPWFTPEQWARLLDVANERIEIANDEPGKHRHARQDVRDFILLQCATGMRVDELRSVRVRDVKVRVSQRQTMGGHALPPEVAKLLKGRNVALDSNEYLEIDLHEGLIEGTTEGLKRGPRTVVTRRAYNGVAVFRSLVERKKLKPNDRLFEEHHRDAFRELLIAARMRSVNGMNRNLKSVRCTGIMLWVLAEPNVNLKLLAGNFGTSVQMLDQFYLKPLNVQMNREALVGLEPT
jgi:integrase